MSRARALAAFAGAFLLLPACTLLVSTKGLSGGAEGLTTADGGESGTSDAPPGSDGGSDARPASCDLTKPFGPLKALASPLNSGSNELAGYFSPDRLTMYVASDRGAMGDLFTFRRPDLAGMWGPATPISELNTGEYDSDPWVSADELTIYFDTSRAASSSGSNIFRAKRANKSEPFGAPEIVENIQSNDDEKEPWLDPTQSRLYLSSNGLNGNKNGELYVSQRDANGRFGAPTRISELGSGGYEESPFLTADELTIYFASDRPGGLGDKDIYVATRSTREAPFNAPKLVPELSTTSGDYPTWLSDDGCRIVIESYEPGNADLFYAERPE